MSKRPLVILDFNGTVVDSTQRQRPGIPADGKARFKWVYFRPGMREFFVWLFDRFDVGVWTSHSRQNADALAEVVFTEKQRERLVFVMCGDDCLWKPNYRGCKPLRRVWDAYPEYGRQNTVIVDDSDDKISEEDAACHVRIPTFRADAPARVDDGTLIKLRRHLGRRFAPHEQTNRVTNS